MYTRTKDLTPTERSERIARINHRLETTSKVIYSGIILYTIVYIASYVGTKDATVNVFNTLAQEIKNELKDTV